MMKSVGVLSPGAGYRLEICERPIPRPREGELLIKVLSAGLNHADILQSKGRYPPPHGASKILGLEVSGIVAQIGGNSSPYPVGQRVCALVGGGGYAEYVVASTKCTLPAPTSVNGRDMAAFPEAMFTVWKNLFHIAALRPGETVLVHGGSSGIGVSAIQLLSKRGHAVFTTVGTDKKAKTCETLGAKRAINYNEKDFVKVIEAEVGRNCIDVILDMVGGDYIQRNLSVAAPGGRIVNIAYMKGTKAEIDFSAVLAKNLILAASTLRNKSDEEKGLIRDALLRDVWPLIASQEIVPIVGARFPLSEAGKAHALMRSGENTGKILLDIA